MLYRFNRLFNVSKTRALVVSILCFLGGLPFMFGGELAMIGGACWVYGLIYGCIWYYKYNRDKRLAERSKPVNQQHIEAMPPMSSPGSSRLFVPNPLDRP